MLYLVFITIALCFGYFLLPLVFSLFAGRGKRVSFKRRLCSLVTLVVASAIGYTLAFQIADEELSNRVTHALGGFFSVTLGYLVVRDFGFVFSKIAFLVLVGLIATALGVGNEILEYFLQNHLAYISADNINDTWLDLISNTVGIAVAALILTPFVSGGKVSKVAD